MSVAHLVREHAQVGLELLGVELGEAGLEHEVVDAQLRARACTAPESVSVIISTGGCRFILARRFTTSKPPWNEEPPEVGMPRSVTRTKGMPALPSRSAFLTAASGSSASTTW